MKEKVSRERCFQNAMGMLTTLNMWMPKRQVTLSIHEYAITLTMFFDKSETELMDAIMTMIKPIMLDCANYTKNYYEEDEFFSVRYAWEIHD